MTDDKDRCEECGSTNLAYDEGSRFCVDCDERAGYCMTCGASTGSADLHTITLDDEKSATTCLREHCVTNAVRRLHEETSKLATVETNGPKRNVDVMVELVKGEVFELPDDALIVLPTDTGVDVCEQLQELFNERWPEKRFVALLADDVRVLATQAAQT